MIADESFFMRALERKILQRSGFEVVAEVDNGKDAVIEYMKYKPDILLLDITMGNLGGIGVLKRIRFFYPVAKIIMRSLVGKDNFVTDAIKAGAKHFLIKPCQADVLVKTISEVLEGKP